MDNALRVTMDYTAAFERTFEDDDWTRLTPFFAEDAVYEVRGGPYACRLKGRSAIFAGMKKSVDGLDRRCDDRQIELIDGPQVEETPAGKVVSLDWRVCYQYGKAPRASFAGRTVATVADGRIVDLRDEYTDEDLEGFQRWMRDYGEGLDGAYV
ncbi:MAG: nuclear transport factor 2 family protein [Halioglobus sp.]|nr:nuclear transport factor 2 family protein [Halioglobus sp.]